jgi:MGT family glycosyltransferase
MTGGFGSLAQVLPILEHLDRAKYRIVCSIAHGAACALQRLGYEIIPYPDVGEPGVVTPKGRAWHDLDHYWGRFGYADRRYFSALIASRLRLIDDIQPDILLTQFCPPTEVIARITRLPLVCVTQSCWHPAGKPISFWVEQRGAGAGHPRVTPVVNAILERYGAAPIGRMEDLNRGDLTLIPSFPELDPVDDPGARFLGPLSWTSSGDVAQGSSASRGAPSSRPMILVYTGKLHDSAGDSGILILERAVEALKDTEFDVVVTIGLGQDLDLQAYARPNVRLYDWVPLNRLLRRACLLIHHGGHGSSMAAIVAGVRSLVIPTFQEREFNARQLRALGLGHFVSPDDLTASRLAREVRACMDDPAIPGQLRRWRAELERRRYGGAAWAAEQIDALGV